MSETCLLSESTGLLENNLRQSLITCPHMSSPSHNCASTVGALAGLATSLTLCLEARVWTCQSKAKSWSISAISAALFLLVNAMQHKMPASFVTPANYMVTIAPPLMFTLAEFVNCKDKEYMSVGRRLMNLADLVPIFLLPTAIFVISGSPKLHDKICASLHGLEFHSVKEKVNTMRSNPDSILNRLQARENTGAQQAKAYGGQKIAKTVVIPGETSGLNTQSSRVPLSGFYTSSRGYFGN